jgi:hypothetical protein
MIGRHAADAAGVASPKEGSATMTRALEASVDSTASPEDIFRLLADLRTHLEWGGRAYAGRGEHLIALDAPPGSAAVGTTWTSTGKAHEGGYEDRSVVTALEAPRRFEFRTDSSFRRGSSVTSYALNHTYMVSPTPSGSRITHREELGPPSGGTWFSRLLLSGALAPITDRVGRGLLRTGLEHLAAMAESNEG